MHRRSFLSNATLAALTLPLTARGTACGAIAAPAVIPEPTREAVLATPWRASSSGYSDAAFRLARGIERSFGGGVRIVVETQAGGGAGNSDRIAADFCFASESSNTGHAPAFAFFAELPGHLGLSAMEHVQWLEDGGGQKLWDSLAADFGFKPLLAGCSDLHPPLWSLSPVLDFNGLRVNADGLAADVLRALGGRAVDCPPEKLGQALRQGTIDAAAAGDLAQAISSGIATEARHALASALFGAGPILSLCVSQRLWTRLSREDRERLAQVARAHAMDAAARSAGNAHVMRHLLAQKGVAFTEVDGAMALAIARVSEAVVADLASRDPTARRINAAYMAYRAGCVRQS